MTSRIFWIIAWVEGSLKFLARYFRGEEDEREHREREADEGAASDR